MGTSVISAGTADELLCIVCHEDTTPVTTVVFHMGFAWHETCDKMWKTCEACNGPWYNTLDLKCVMCNKNQINARTKK